MKFNRKIKVLVVDDSGIFRRILANQLKDNQYIEVVGMAKDPYEARDMIIKYSPDVLILDIMMPGIDGIEFLNILKNKRPIPAIAISGSSNNKTSAIAAGATDFIEKPTAKTMNYFTESLIKKIKDAVDFCEDSFVNIEPVNSNSSDLENKTVKNIKSNIIYNNKSLIAIGASMGGVDAIRRVLIELPLGLPGIVITQHMPPVFTERYAQRLDKECSIKVVEGKDGDEVLSGYAYLAPGGFQMGIRREKNKYVLDIKKGDKVSGHCPSVDYLFESVATHAKDNSVAVILTGMGNDGAKGLLSIKNAGGYTIGQNKETCVVYGMPMAAKNIGAVSKEVSLDAIPNLILDKFRKK